MKKIRGAGGGGGKGGGGGGRVAVESPDSLRSKQYARVIDAVSEGEIYGLVNGLKSVYLNDTPIQNSDDSFNFSGITLLSRNGTQNQTFIEGFSAVESEIPVSAEITNATPIVRTISNANIDAVRVTISIPVLTFQDTSTGDLSGTSVQLAIDLQSDGGGFVPVPIEKVWQQVASGVSEFSGTGYAAQFSIDFQHNYTIPPYEENGFYEPVSYLVEYIPPGGSWTTLESGVLVYANSEIQNKTFTTPTGINGVWGMRVTINSGGTLNGSRGFVYAYTNVLTISGKTTSTYQRAVRVDLTGNAPWDIRVRRITADSTQSNIRNQTYFASYTEIIDSKLSYPNTAVVGLAVDAEQFNSIPTRGYEIKGLLVRIPSNYNPDTREYTGIWDGTFDVAWTNNPAWCFYDLLTNDRYGLGAFISEDQVDKWSLYQIAQYCDELVDDGFGNLEPRFTCNLYLQTREEAYNVIQSMASIFRGLTYWAGGTVVAVQDAPSNPVALFTPANVQGGVFNYQGSSLKARHTVALVSWNDPDDRYKQKIEYVDDPEAIATLGVIQTEVVAFGCTSRGQAHRLGRSILYSERLETETVSFRCGMDSVFVMPGEIIQTTDPVRAGKRMGGRVISATNTDIEIDQTVTIEAGKTYTLWSILPDGTLESQQVTNAPGQFSTLTVGGFSSAPQNMAIWVLGANDLVPELWRVVSLAEADEGMVDITAVAYRADKYAAIESDLILEPLQTSVIDTAAQTPTNLVISESLYLVSPVVVGTRITVSWQGNSPFYELQYRKQDGNWVTVTTQANSVDIQPVTAGTYEFRLNAVNAIGRRSSTVTASTIVYGLTNLPADVDDLSLNAISGSALISWAPSADLDVIVGGYLRIRHTPELINPEWNNSVDIGQQVPGTATNTALPLLSGSYLAKWVDSSGNESANANFISTNAPSLIGLNFIANVEQSPDFVGSKVNVVKVPGGIVLDSAETIGEQLGLISTWPKLSALGGIAQQGTYFFDQNIDLGTVQTSRLTASLTSVGFDALDLISERGLISSWPSVIGDLINDVGCTIYVRTTDDDPDSSSSAWSDWAPFVVGDYQARGFEFKAILYSDYPTHNIQVSQLAVQVDMPDRIDSGDDITSGAGILTQNFNLTFMIPPALSITAQDMETGDYYEISNKTTDSFDIIFKNAGGSAISRTFDYLARAY